MNEKELVGKTLAIWKIGDSSLYEGRQILCGRVRDNDGVLVLDMDCEIDPLPIQSEWLEKIAPSSDQYDVLFEGADYYLTVGFHPDFQDHKNSINRTMIQQDKVKRAKKIRWMVAGAALGCAYAIWQVNVNDTGNYFNALTLCGGFGAFMGYSTGGESNWEKRREAIWWVGALGLTYLYALLLQYQWPTGPTWCGITREEGYSFGLESFLLMSFTLPLFMMVTNWLSKLPKRLKVSLSYDD